MEWRRHTRRETRELRHAKHSSVFDGGEFIVVDGVHCGLRARVDAGMTTIGRADDNGIALTLDPGVSRRHAVVEWTAGRLSLRDLGSTNGTLINGAQVQGRAGLSHLDIVTVGGSSLQIVFDENATLPVYELTDPGETADQAPV